MRAGRNPLSVLTIFRFAAYLNLVQNPMVLFGLAPCGTDFSFHYWKPQILSSLYTPIWIFSALLPAISDYPSPDHKFYTERGVSSALAAFVHQLALVSIKYFQIIWIYLFNLESKYLSSYLPRLDLLLVK